MARLGWDQSFLEDFSRSDDLDPSANDLELSSYDKNIIHYENIYNIFSPGGPELTDAPVDIIYVNSSVTEENDRLKFLLDQVERKKWSHLVDNSYSPSSQFSSPPSSPARSPASGSPVSGSPVLGSPVLGSSLPPSPILHQKSQKPSRKDFDKSVRSSPRENSLARNATTSQGHDLLTPSSFFVFRLVERYGLAKLLKQKCPRDPIFRSDSPPTHVGPSSAPDPQGEPLSYTPSELRTLRINLIFLLESGFYLGKLSADESKGLLSRSNIGAFFVRDSSNPDYLLSLSVQTKRGATSIRIFFRGGAFGLETHSESSFVPTFDSVPRLVRHYVENPNKNVLVESSGRCDTPVILKRPLVLRAPRLTHLCRLVIHKHLGGKSVDRLCLIPSLKQFLKQYPFSV